MKTAEGYVGTRYFNGYRIGSWALHGASGLTTYWLCEWIGQPAEPEGYVITITLSIILEFFVLHKMKKALFDANQANDAIGWAGFIIDSAINMGGILPKMFRLAAWPPIAALAAIGEFDTTKGAANTALGFILALALGILLSVAPIRLDQMAEAE